MLLSISARDALLGQILESVTVSAQSSVGQLYQLAPRLREHLRRGVKNLKTRGLEGVLRNSVWWAGHGYYTHEPKAALATYTGSSQPMNQQVGKKAHDAPPLTKQLLAAGGRGVTSIFPGGVWLLVGCPCLVDDPNL